MSKTKYPDTNIRVNKQYRKKYDSDGNPYYEECGEVNISEYVNSFGNVASLDSILSRISYLPVSEKIKALSMRSDGMQGDSRAIPKDGTDAFLLLKKYEDILPGISERLKNGESLDSILKTIYSPQTVKEDPKIEIVQNTQESEVTTNG